uniref:1-alkyl-2-acetylglycerophosphocholine esterase n=1 Tax=Wollemia nobilis TaxID=56998 RepID=A0A0C9RVT7_9CONI
MGLPKPLGPYHVSMADFQLPANSQGICDTPLLRFYYPTTEKESRKNTSANRWMPHFAYTWGYASKVIAPTSSFHRFLVWILAGILYAYSWVCARIKASVASQLLTIQGQNDQFPVVVFSHGLWACRTTYSALCCDLASHGYVVVALEHLDGSANMASYVGKDGKRKWMEHKFSHIKYTIVPMQERIKQLNQRVAEVRRVVDVLESLNLGLLAQSANTITDITRLDVTMFKGRLDLSHVAVSGHSFGGVTAVVAAGADARFCCCLALDAWLEPMTEENYEQHAGNVPILLLNTEAFDWKALRECRLKLLRKRETMSINGRSLVTELITIKGTRHQDQSDVNIIFPTIMKNFGLVGSMDLKLAKDINSRRCLAFLYKYLLPPGSGKPYVVDEVLEDYEHLLISSKHC